MPLRLKSLELHGYKTFAANFNFEFAAGITAIVGPNGSGKSNIADAIRWVLGEQSYSILRAKKTEDMIFSGSEQRSRSGMASATVIFDNSNNWLPIDFNEVALSRRAYRDGRNEYLLNSQHVRLKDINELLARSGLSERTYTILGQGLVDASLALKADERRKLFEEAAGIGLYRSRREEALRRIETARRNLDRVLDILAELEPRLKSLERQAARAKEYGQVQADLRVLLREWYGYHWFHAQNELEEVIKSAQQQEIRLSEARASFQVQRDEYAAFREKLNNLRSRLNSWHRQSSLLHSSREIISSDMAVIEERSRSVSDQRQQVINENAKVEQDISLADEKIKDAMTEIERLQTDMQDTHTQLTRAQENLDSAEDQKISLEKELEAIRGRIDEHSAQRASLRGRQEDLYARKEAVKKRLDESSHSLSSLNNSVKNAEEQLLQRKKELLHREEALQAKRDSLAEAHLAEVALGEKIEQKRRILESRKVEETRFHAQINVLDQAEQSLAGYAEGSKKILEAGKQSELKGVIGAFSSVLEVPEEFEHAIAAVLGEYTDAILLKSSEHLEQALVLLEEITSGRASLLPLDRLLPGDTLQGSTTDGVIGIAADLVNCPPEYSPAVDLLLGQVLVIKDRRLAQKVLREHGSATRAVTLKGEVFYSSGQVIAGKSAQVSALRRPRQRKELQESIFKNQQQLKDIELELKSHDEKMDDLQRKVAVFETEVNQAAAEAESSKSMVQEALQTFETLQRQQAWQQEQLTALQADIGAIQTETALVGAALHDSEAELTILQDQLQEKNSLLENILPSDLHEDVLLWTARYAVIEHALSTARTREAERKESFTRMLAQKENLGARIQDLETSLATCVSERESLLKRSQEHTSQLDELRQLIDPAEKELADSEHQEALLHKQEVEAQAALGRVERMYNQVQLELGRKQESLDNLRARIEDDFGLVMFDYAEDVSGPVPLPLEGLVEQLTVVSILAPDLEENIIRQRAQLRRMGAVNPDAQQEYLSVKERYTFLHTQVEDLHKAEADLHQVIAELDELTRREFQKTFDAVAQQFHEIFHRLFGGGSASLVLTEPDNITETGIDIEARLPGRREQGLSLLSGGERSLTAIALVFALLKISPTPVCVMDEVDAMLDEANVSRFRDLLAELSRDTQFIIITHNRNTVQAADVIYGVTMGRDSTSKVISLKMDEVSAEYTK